MLWRLLIWRLPMLGGLIVGSCAPQTLPRPAAHITYAVGAPYQDAGVWRYPAERFGGTETGLAIRHAGARLATDGEVWDDTQMLVSHPTLQTPAIVRVTNLDTGMTITARVIDRGPPGRGRVAGLSDRAAVALGLGERPIPVRVDVDGARSQALRDRLHPGQTGLIAAPSAAVQQEILPGAPGALRAVAIISKDAPAGETPLPDGAEAGPRSPGQIWLRAGTFDGADAARLQAGRLAAIAPRIERAGTGRAETYTVRAGPFADAAAADTALDQAVLAGVTDVRIVVE